MSAYVLNDNNIDALLTALRAKYTLAGRSTFTLDGTKLDVHDDEALDMLGAILIKQNYQSVNYRYKENTQPHEYKFKECELLNDVQLFKLCDCYDYQACEAPDYSQTNAHKLIDRLRHAIISSLPGYSEASWGL